MIDVTNLDQNERDQLMKMAIGRLFLLGSRPFQEGDLETYHDCRSVVLALAEDTTPAYQPNYARDRLRGAAGD